MASNSSSQMQVGDLCELLPSKTTPLGALKSSADAIDTDPTAASYYVDHELSVSSWPDAARAILIEAPAAVGKSELSRALAQRLQWPLIFAERGYVGMYSIKGLLTDSLTESSSFIREVETAQAGIVVDALDEAQLKAGTNNFLAFLDDAISLVQPPVDRSEEAIPSLILLSRPDTAEIVTERFQEKSVPLAILHVQFLSLEKVSDFALSYLRHRSSIVAPESARDYNSAIEHGPATTNLLRERLADIANSLQGVRPNELEERWPDVAPFLGYPPVLATLAESLAVPNASAAPKLSQAGKAELLLEVLENILEREAEKFARNAGLKLFASLEASDLSVTREDFIKTLYSPTEQLERLANWVSRRQARSDLPVQLPTSIRADYERNVDEFLPNHPFITDRSFTNTVFRDFVSASLSRSESYEVESSEAAGPFYARFLNAKLSSSATVVPEIAERMLEPSIQSWRLERQLAGQAPLVLINANGDAPSLDLLSPDSDESLHFGLKELGGFVSLRGQVRDTTVVAENVVLGTQGEPLTLGPGCAILADEVDIQSERLTVRHHPRGIGGLMYAKCIAANGLREVEATPSFFISAESVPPRLQPFRASNPFAGSHATVPHSYFMDIRALLISFESGAESQPSCFADKMDRRIVGNREGREKILTSLVADGIIERRGNFYYLDLRLLREAELDFSGIREGHVTDETLDYLARVL